VATVRPGGQVLYSVCTWTRAETDGVVDDALRRHPELEPAPLTGLPGPLGTTAATGPASPSDRHQFWPHRDESDGIYLARLRKIH
jgi:16S rRNA (cytosine967-C5)-methyltransferase